MQVLNVHWPVLLGASLHSFARINPGVASDLMGAVYLNKVTTSEVVSWMFVREMVGFLFVSSAATPGIYI